METVAGFMAVMEEGQPSKGNYYMKFEVSCGDTQARIGIAGDIDERGAEEMKQCFRKLPISTLKDVTINMEKVTHIGSAGIGKLLVLYKDLAVHDAGLSLVNVPAGIFELFREMKLDTIFKIAVP